MRQVYLDHNATTPVLPEVLEALLRYYHEDFGNPSSVHRYGRRARVAIDDTRDCVADMLGAPASAIFFSSGGTRSIIRSSRAWRQRSKDAGATW